MNNGKVSPKEINGLKLSLEQIPVVKSVLKGSGDKSLKAFIKRFGDTNGVVNLITKTLHPEAPTQIKQGNVILGGVDDDLDELRELSTGGKEWIAALQKTERERTGISSLKVGFNKVFGYYLEITKAHSETVPEEYIRKQTLVNSERYITPDLKEYEEKILSADEKIEAIESRIFNDLCSQILSQVAVLQENASVLSQLDVLATFATIAKANKYIRPTLNDNGALKIGNIVFYMRSNEFDNIIRQVHPVLLCLIH